MLVYLCSPRFPSWPQKWLRLDWKWRRRPCCRSHCLFPVKINKCINRSSKHYQQGWKQEKKVWFVFGSLKWLAVTIDLNKDGHHIFTSCQPFSTGTLSFWPGFLDVSPFANIFWSILAPAIRGPPDLQTSLLRSSHVISGVLGFWYEMKSKTVSLSKESLTCDWRSFSHSQLVAKWKKRFPDQL